MSITPLSETLMAKKREWKAWALVSKHSGAMDLTLYSTRDFARKSLFRRGASIPTRVRITEVK